MITVVHGSPKTIWVPVEVSGTIYVGSIVGEDVSGIATNEGFIKLPVAAGVGNATNYDVPLGVCIGTNEKNPVYNSTYLAEYTTQQGASDPQDGSTREYAGVEGPFSKGDCTSYVKVALITPSTLLRAPLRVGAIGTNLTERTCTTGNSSGVAGTFGGCDFTPVAGLSTAYCRKGANAGIYRQRSDASTTAWTWSLATPADVEAGSVWVSAPIKLGVSYAYIGDGTVMSYIDCSATASTNYFHIYVTSLDMREKGNEYAEFYFLSTHFIPHIVSRATT